MRVYGQTKAGRIQARSEWRFSSPLSLALSITSFIILALNVPSEAIDVGGILKNIGKANRANNDYDADASTGTITTLEPGKEKEPVTCNEIMAKAVVVANEEKAIAFSDRDSALAAAQEAILKAQEMTAEVHEMKIQVEEMIAKTKEVEKARSDGIAAADEKAKNEIQAAKEYADEEISKAQEGAKAAIEKTNQDAAEKIQLAQNDARKAQEEAKKQIQQNLDDTEAELKKMKDETKATVESVEKEAKEAIEANTQSTQKLIAQTKLDAQESINTIQSAATLQISNTNQAKLDFQLGMEEEMGRLKEKTDKLILETKQNAAAEIASTKAEAVKAINKANADAQNARNEANSEIVKMKKVANSMVKAIKEETHEEIIKIQKDAAEEIQTIRERTDAIVADVHEKMLTTKQKAEEDIDANNKKTQAQIEDILKQKDELETKMKGLIQNEKDTVASLENIKEELEGQLSEMTNNFKDEVEKVAKLLANKKTLENDLGAMTIKFKNEETNVSNLQQAKEKIEKELEKTQYDLDHWEGLHRSQSYVNTTLILHDTQNALKSVAEIAAQKYDTASTTIRSESAVYYQKAQEKTSKLYEETRVQTEPHLAKLLELYEANLAEIVDDKVLPIYRQHVIPFYKNHVVPMITRGKEVSIKAENKIVEMFSSFMDFCIDQVHLAAVKAIEIIKQYPSTPVLILESTFYVRDNSSEVVSMILKAISIFVLYTLRYKILTFVAWIIKLPLRIFWFFCPLRFFISKKKIDGKKENGARDEDKNIVEKDIAENVNDSKGDPDADSQVQAEELSSTNEYSVESGSTVGTTSVKKENAEVNRGHAQ